MYDADGGLILMGPRVSSNFQVCLRTRNSRNSRIGDSLQPVSTPEPSRLGAIFDLVSFRCLLVKSIAPGSLLSTWSVPCIDLVEGKVMSRLRAVAHWALASIGWSYGVGCMQVISISDIDNHWADIGQRITKVRYFTAGG